MKRDGLLLPCVVLIACKVSSGAAPGMHHPADGGARDGAVTVGPGHDAGRPHNGADAQVEPGHDASRPYDGGADAHIPPGDPCARPGTLCWDFEGGDLSGWEPYRNEFAGELLVDDTRSHRGRFALHAKDLSGGVEGQQGGPKHTVRYTLPSDFGPLLWGRAFVYTTPARPVSHAGLFNARYPRPNATATDITALDWYEVATYQEKYMVVWHPPEPPGYPEWVKVADEPVVLDAWACLEWLFDGENAGQDQAADPRLWLDGVELTWPAPFVFSDPPTDQRPIQEKVQNFSVLETGAYLYQGLTTPTSFWIDDLAVGRERIGCDSAPK
jgi:hypothetical protein